MRCRAIALVGALIVTSLVSACSSDSDSDGASEETAAVGETTVPPSIVPLTTTTTIVGTPVSDAELYAEIGLSPEQGACIEASGIDGDFESTPGPGLLDAIVLTAEGGKMVAVPPTVRTGAELEQLMLDALAGDCAPADRLAELARIDGQALDDAAILDDLPVRLFQRRADGATPDELTCIEARFREAPVRLTSLAASPRLVESQCAPTERLDQWRRTAIERGLSTAGATAAERSCLTDSAPDQALLAAAVDAVGSGDTSTNPLGTATPTCATADRMLQLAVDVVAKGSDFGAESLGPG